MDVETDISAEEKARVDRLLRTCFPDVKDFDKIFSYSLEFQPNAKSFWSRVVRVALHCSDETVSERFPRTLFLKIPHLTENLKRVNEEIPVMEEDDAQLLLKFTQMEILWYKDFGAADIPYFPIPKFYAAETPTIPGTGIIAMEDLCGRVKAMELVPGFSSEQVERVMDALAGLHFHLISITDQSWVSNFDRSSEVNQDFQDLQFTAAMKFESLCPEKFAGRIKGLEEHFSTKNAVSALYCFQELGVPPVLVHSDLNPSNILWSAAAPKSNELIAIIDFQMFHTGLFTEDIVRVLALCLSRSDRRAMTTTFLRRYHDTLSRLFDGKPPYSFKKVEEAYDRIFLYASNFAFFALSVYYDMSEELEKDPIRLDGFRKEAIDRAYGILIDAEHVISRMSP
ncbi:unnamed protein product [Nippostrongylus brasiliensis]|uniref:CHK domain-containing protein n=1 Tax=Nippostrongylus brasiliensis TaxID=27835 RepID=A0A0N4XTQ8_NIPBR|nr:unnamed protein product [Nippostrongylus brasiliensis]